MNQAHRGENSPVTPVSNDPMPGLNEMVSTVELKSLARRLLPYDSALRALILAESDTMERREALVKAEIFVKLLYRELRLG